MKTKTCKKHKKRSVYLKKHRDKTQSKETRDWFFGCFCDEEMKVAKVNRKSGRLF